MASRINNLASSLSVSYSYLFRLSSSVSPSSSVASVRGLPTRARQSALANRPPSAGGRSSSPASAWPRASCWRACSTAVIVADFSPRAFGARSRALDAFYVLRRPGPGDAGGYLDSVLKAVEAEGAQLRVICSGVASAMEDGLAKEQTSVLHDKGALMRYTRDVVGLRVPESHTGVGQGGYCRFIAKSVGLNDKSRGDMTLLPLETAEKTRAFVSQLEALGISDAEPWLLQEFIAGTEYCTHSLVVRGEVGGFTACTSTELLMHYEALRDDSPLVLAMLDFTRTMAHSFGEDFTGHLSFDFIVREPGAGATTPEQVELYPIECSPRAHTAAVLFEDTPALVKEYLAVLDGDRAEGATGRLPAVVTPEHSQRYYWVGHDLVTQLLLPTLQLVLLQISPFEYVRNVWGFLNHLLFWRDGTWGPRDPVPWRWLYHVYWPLRFWDSFVNGPSWSRINVSTTKMFECE